MRCARSIISKNAQYFHAALKYIYLYRHAHPDTHKQPFIKGAKSLEFMVSFVYRGMNASLSFSPCFGTHDVSAIQNILPAKYTFQKYINFTQTATIKEST